MSGLAALFQRDGRAAERQAVAAMLTAAPYRGPDGMRLHVHASIALGHAKMAVTPEEAGEQQPLVSPRTGCVVIADARLDNREELLAHLPKAPSGCGDAELILRAYETWGADAAPRLLGDFAFLLWDPRLRRLLGARDTSGQRALFYRVDHRAFAAASEIQQLLHDPDVPIRPNEERIRESLVPLHVFHNEKDQAATFYEGILALPAGHMLLVDAERLQTRRYWQLTPGELRYRNDDEYAEHYRELLFEVVRARLRSARPIGVSLSGGLDSSSIAGTAQQLYRAGRATDHGFIGFNSIFDEMPCDERPFIEDIQAQYGFPIQYVSPGGFAGRLQLEPLGFREAPNMGVAEARDAMFGAVTRSGARALLTGDIADACTFGSPMVFDLLLRRGDLRALGRQLRAFGRTSGESLRRIAALHAVAPLLPLPLHKRLIAAYMHYAIQKNWPFLVPSWMPEDLRTDLRRRHRRVTLATERARRFSNDTREVEYRLLYPPEVARHPVPWSLQIWRPFADRRLHQFLLAIPPEQKFRPHPESEELYAGAKRLVRQSMRGVVPESIRTRTSKTVFSAVLAEEVARQWPTYEAAFGPAAQSEVARRGYVDQRQFWLRLQALRQGGYGSDLVYVQNILDLETWLRATQLPRPRAVRVAAAVPGADSLAAITAS